MYDESNNGDNQSFELYTINTQSSSSKQKHVESKSVRAKHWKKILKNSVKHRRNILNKTLTSGGDSLIKVFGHDHNLKSHQTKSDDIITINVSGNRYQTRLSTLEIYPNTLLGNKEKRKYYFNPETNEYFFDRHRSCFESILYYYQSNGRLRRPDYVPLDTFLEEIIFFDLGSEIITQINKLENISIIKYIDLPNWLWRRYIWVYLEYPQNSLLARIIHFISMIFVVLSCITLAVETLPKYDNSLCQKQDLNDTSMCSSMVYSPFFIIQTICVSYFTIEFLLRLISTPSYYRFILSIFNWIDLATILPYFVFLGLEFGGNEIYLDKSLFTGLRILQILRFLRVFKMYLVFKQLKSLRVLSSTLKESFIDFIIMIIILTLMAFLFGAAIYFAEQNANGKVFDSIPKATYWGILTITTVGYGDMYPITVIGRILACSCAFCGIATTGILVSVLVNHYQRIYNRKQFSPEQIISAIDSSDNDHDEKQDFINRNLSGIKKTLSGGSNLSFPTAPPILSSNNNTKYSRYHSSSSYVRFIITIIDDQTNKKFIHKIKNELMTELTQTVKSTGDQIHFKLICTETDPSKEASISE